MSDDHMYDLSCANPVWPPVVHPGRTAHCVQTVYKNHTKQSGEGGMVSSHGCGCCAGCSQGLLSCMCHLLTVLPSSATV